jgi:protein SEY1
VNECIYYFVYGNGKSRQGGADDSFEDRFRYDDQGVPHIWHPSDNIDAIFKSALEETLHLIPIFAEATLSNGNNPALDIPPPPDYTTKFFFTLLSPTKQVDLTTHFKRATDALYVEAKRSVISSISQVPAWFYVILLVLGWNELMAVLRNPISFRVIYRNGGGRVFSCAGGMVGPMAKVGNAVLEQSVEIARVHLASY